MGRALLLFDVDGTLLISGGATTRCIRRAAGHVLGEGLKCPEITSGTLDQDIFAVIAAASGKDAGPLLEAYKRIYLHELAAELDRCRADIRVMPGIPEVLSKFAAREDVICGLLTGNFREAANLKLQAAGLAPSTFRVGAFAEDGARRGDLVAAALTECWLKLGFRLEPQNVVLIGDTPRDVQCAKDAACRILAVATGHYSMAELQQCGPDCVAADLTDATVLDRLIEQARLNR